MLQTRHHVSAHLRAVQVDGAVAGPGEVRAHLQCPERGAHLREEPVVSTHQGRRGTTCKGDALVLITETF